MILYECACRECEVEWNEWLHMADKAPACRNCGSENTYRCVGSTPFRLRGGNWAFDGYAQEPGTRSVNIGPPSPQEKQAAKKVIEDRKEQGREARREAGLKE